MGKAYRSNQERVDYLNKKQNEIADNQENQLVLDFDKALEDGSKRPIIIKLIGKKYEVPSEMPFNFSTFFLRHCYKKIDGKMTVVMDDDKVLPYIELMFGKEFLDDVSKPENTKVSINFVFDKIAPAIMKQWGYDIDTSNKEDIQKKMMNRG